MKIHIMTDLEGCAGIMNERDYLYENSRYYELARELLTLEVSAAVEGALEAGATEVLVVDGHGAGALNRQLLHPRARLLGGRPVPPGAVSFGVDGTFAASLVIGQHAKSNTDGGHLAHTMSFNIEEYRLNDISVGELGLWMLVAGYFGVPVVMVSGDQAACDEARSLVPNVEIAPVKWGLKRGSAARLTRDENAVFNSMATHLHPNEARAVIREHAFRAVKRIPEIAPFRLDSPYTLSVAQRPEESGKEGTTGVAKAADFLDLLTTHRVPVVKAKPAPARKTGAKPAARPAPAKPAARPKAAPAKPAAKPSARKR